jgi:NAD(P)H-dependent flavin oxidoreductase YrpB (nitropropane dioxygenase family)
MSFRTPLCDLLGVEYLILHSGMGGVAGPELVAEVSKAGGLGIIAGLSPPRDEPAGEVVEQIIREARAVLGDLSRRIR